MLIEEEKKKVDVSRRFEAPRFFFEGTVATDEFLQKSKGKSKSLGDYLYVFRIEAGGQNWHVTKSFREILKITSAVLLNKEVRKARNKKGAMFLLDKVKQDVPAQFADGVAKNLQELGTNASIVNSQVFKEFCEVSEMSFTIGDTQRYKEGYLRKRSGGRFKHEHRCFLCYFGKCCRKWTNRWFIVTHDFIAYLINSQYTTVHEVMLFDPTFKVTHGREATGLERGILVQNSTRALLLEAENEVDQRIWVRAIEEAFEKSEWNPKFAKRFDSFAPERSFTLCHWFVDGESYFTAVYDALMHATREVYITDWWLCPKLYLKRPVAADKRRRNEESRLDLVLKSLAQRGVNIYILLFKEVEMALPLKSAYSKIVLRRRSEQIKVMRHPRTLLSLWSHHEKLLIIDQELAFLGGIDLCFGRMDTSAHHLSDLPNEKGEIMFPGQDYNNVRIADFKDVNKKELCLIDRSTQPRMPWHDVSVSLRGPAVKDLIVHFIHYWNHARIDITGTTSKQGLLNPRFSVYDSSSMSGRRGKLEGLSSLEISQEMEEELEANLKRVETSKSPRNRHTVPARKHSRPNITMSNIFPRPGQELAKGLPPIAEEVAKSSVYARRQSVNEEFPIVEFKYLQAFQEYCQQEKDKLAKSKKERLKGVLGLKKTELGRAKLMADFVAQQSTREQLQETQQEETVAQQEQNDDLFIPLNNPKFLPSLPSKDSGACKCQILRSASNWSMGFAEDVVECSVYTAYLHLIEQSKHYIYIENQFFISCYATTDCPVKNRIATAIFNRITRAHTTNENFKVYLVLPLYPGNEGDVADASKSAVMRVLLHYERRTIGQAPGSLLDRLTREGIDPSTYLVILGLRQHEKIGPLPVTELIYVHSKLIIVDDQYAIIGSANINDRSMVGYHDSELAVSGKLTFRQVLVEDTLEQDSVMCGQPYKAKNFARSLRINLMKEHFGYEEDKEVADPLSEVLWTEVKARARKNTEVYREVFGCDPDDTVKSMKELVTMRERIKARKPEEQLEKYESLKGQIKGQIVEWPTWFFMEEDLKFGWLQVEGILPERNFLQSLRSQNNCLL